MEEENKTNFEAAPKKKGSKKPLIICLSIILVLAIIAVIVGVVLMKSGKLNFSKKAKMQAGIDQLTESLIKPIDDLTTAIENNDLEIKALNNISKGDAVGVNAEFSTSIDKLEISDMSSSDKEIVDALKDFLNSSTIGINAQYDGKERVYGNATLTMDGTDVSLEGLYDGEKAAFRSKEINEKWLGITKKDLLAQMGITESDIEQAKKTYDKLLDTMEKSLESASIDEKTAEEIEKRYKEVLKDFINDKEKDIKSEKDKVKVDGKEKSANKLTITLDEKDIKKLAKNYITTFQNDSQLQGIIKNYLESYANSMSEMAEELDISNYEIREMESTVDQFEKMLSELDSLATQIDQAQIDVKVKLSVWATNTEVYKTEISLDSGKSGTFKLSTVYSGNKSTSEITVSSGTQVINLGTLEIEADNGSGRVKFEASSMLTSLMGTDQMVIDYSYKISSSSEEVNFNFDMGSKIGKGSISAVSNVNKNTENAYEGDTNITIDVNVADEVAVKGSIKAKLGITAGTESIPTVSNADVVDINNTSAMSAYEEASKTKLQELIKKLSSNKALDNLVEASTGESLSELIESLENEVINTPAVIYNTDDSLVGPSSTDV